jgi:antitoxin component of MazEF toxin-antitoxin module
MLEKTEEIEEIEEIDGADILKSLKVFMDLINNISEKSELVSDIIEKMAQLNTLLEEQNFRIYLRQIIELGNSLAITIPQKFTKKLGVEPKDKVILFPLSDSKLLIDFSYLASKDNDFYKFLNLITEKIRNPGERE